MARRPETAASDRPAGRMETNDMTDEPTKGQTRMLEGLQALCRAADKNMNLRMVAFLVAVRLHEGIPMPEIGRLLGINQSAVSRNVSALGEWGRSSRTGLRYIYTEDNPANRKQKVLFTTGKGRKALGDLLSFMPQRITSE